MKMAGRVAGLCSSVAVVLLGVSACTTASSHSSTDTGAPVATGTVPIAHPVTGFTKTAMWRTTRSAVGVPVIVSKAGVIVTDKSSAGYTVRMINAATGKTLWSTTPIAAGDSPPSVQSTTQQGRPYVVVSTVTGKSTQVLVYDGYGTKDGSKPSAQVTVQGKTKPASVSVSTAGVLVSNAIEPAPTFTVDLASGQLTRYGKSPTFHRQNDGTPVAVVNGDYLISYGQHGYVMASGTSSQSWTSDSITPKGAQPGTGKLVATGDSVVLSQWNMAAGGTALVAQSAHTGQVFASATESKRPGAESSSTPVRLAFDGSWAVWGGYAFNLQTGKGKYLPAAADVTPLMIVRSVLYAQSGDSKALTVPLSQGAEKTSAMMAAGMTTAGTGIFTDSRSVYAAPLA